MATRLYDDVMTGKTGVDGMRVGIKRPDSAYDAWRSSLGFSWALKNKSDFFLLVNTLIAKLSPSWT